MDLPQVSRRRLLQVSGCGFGYLALKGMLGQQAQAAPSTVRNPMAVRAPHFTPKAKRIIMLYMAGAPTHVDTFDYKPKLFADGGTRGLLRPPYEFRPAGMSGLHMSELFPNLARHTDDLCIVN